MKKIFTILIVFLSTSAMAGGVLDSEATDYESEYEGQYCATPSLKTCAKDEQTNRARSGYTFNPIQSGGVFQVQRDWYVINNKITFIPVLR